MYMKANNMSEPQYKINYTFPSHEFKTNITILTSLSLTINSSLKITKMGVLAMQDLLGC